MCRGRTTLTLLRDLKLLLSEHPELCGYQDEKGRSLLMWAAIGRSHSCANFLVKKLNRHTRDASTFPGFFYETLNLFRG